MGRLWVDGIDIQDVVVSGKYVYLASKNNEQREVNVVMDGEYAYLDEDHLGTGDILILNVADPVHITKASDLAMPTYRLEKSDNILYITNASQANSGLTFGNVANPNNPQPITGSFPINGTIDVKVQENYAFILDGTTGHPVHLAIVDVSDPTNPKGKGDYYPLP